MGKKESLKLTKAFLIQELVVNKKPVKKLSKEIGVCTVTIYKKMNIYDIELPRFCNISDEEKKVFLDICDNKNMTKNEIMKLFNLSRDKLKSVFQELEIKNYKKAKILPKATAYLKPICFNEDNTIKCICLGCDKITNERRDVLKNGKISCGCFKKAGTQTYFKYLKNEFVTKKIFNDIKRGAIKRNLEFNISREYINDLYIKQNKLCAVSNVEIIFHLKADTKEFSRSKTASLDRIDNKKGYTEDNVQWVHKDVNFMKQQKSDSELIEWCKIISDYQKHKNINPIS